LDIPLIKTSSSCLSIAPTAGAHLPLTLIPLIRRWVRGSMPVKAALLPVSAQYTTTFIEPDNNLLQSQTTRGSTRETNECQCLTRKDGARPAFFPGIAASPECLNFAAILSRRHDQSRFESQKVFQAKLCPLIKAYCLLSIGPEFVHVDVFKRGGKLGSVSAIPVIL
jgi:hypothetical protein